jgi:hypothetical protein
MARMLAPLSINHLAAPLVASGGFADLLFAWNRRKRALVTPALAR